MRRERRIPFLFFVVCLVAAMPVSWGTDASTKVTLCHIPPGKSTNVQTIVVGQAAVAAHLAHGDSLGACPQACGVPAAVPKTGQTTCWDENATVIDCAGTGQDGEYQKGVAVAPRFTDSGDGTVKDNLTGLIWLKDANCFGTQTWPDALTLSNTLASGACGLTDGSVAGAWRLPNRRELESTLDLSENAPALPAGHPFSGIQHYYYWSSTTIAINPWYAWHVNLLWGSVDQGIKIGGDYMWPVRGGQ